MIIYFLKNLRVLGIGLENVIWFFVKRKILECKKYKFDINCFVLLWMISYFVLSIFWD